MTITVSDLQREAKVNYLKNTINQLATQRDQNSASIQKCLKDLADLLGMEVCGEALVEKVV